MTIKHTQSSKEVECQDGSANAQPAPSPDQPERKVWQPKIWGGRIFRFNLHKFRFSEGFSVRRFSILEASVLLILAIIASKGLGVVRQSIFNAFFGTGPEANAFYAANRLPETLFNLISGGALVHAFIPVFLAYDREKGAQEAWRLSSLVFNVMLVALTVVVIVAEFLTPAFVDHILIPGYAASERELTTSLTRIMLFQPLILALGTIVTAVLNSKRQFLLPALSIAIYNIGIIGGLLATKVVPELGIYGPTYGVLVASALQVIVQIPALLKQGGRYTFAWNLRHPGLWQVIRLLGPNSLSIGVVYIALIVETRFTSLYLPDAASLSAIHNADMLQAVPFALISQTIGQALLPHLTVHATAGRFVRMRQMAAKVMGISILLTVPAAIGLGVIGLPLIRLLFQHGEFTVHSSHLTYLALLGYLVGIPGTTAGDMLSRGFFALKDAHTPLLTNTINLIARISMMILLLRFLPEEYVIISIPLAYALSSTIEAIVLFLLLWFRLKRYVKQDKGMVRLLQRRASLAGKV